MRFFVRKQHSPRISDTGRAYHIIFVFRCAGKSDLPLRNVRSQLRDGDEYQFNFDSCRLADFYHGPVTDQGIGVTWVAVVLVLVVVVVAL